MMDASGLETPVAKELLRRAGIEIVEQTPEEFAALILDFYKALLNLGVEKDFAERLTIAFCRRP
jgi:hypothetical protein